MVKVSVVVVVVVVFVATSFVNKGGYNETVCL